jgi:hypothetical protein
VTQALEIIYRFDRPDYLALDWFRLTKRQPHARQNYYYALAWQVALFAIAIAMACLAGQLFVALVLVFWAARNLWHSRSFKHRAMVDLESRAATREAVSVTIRLDEDGMQTKARGIVTIVPWSSITSWERFQHLLVISLVGEQMVAVSETGLSPESASLEDFVKFLESHGIREKK